MFKHVDFLVRLALLLVLIPVIGGIGPRVEGYLLPVWSTLHIEKAIPVGNSTEVWVKFTKLRDCRLVGVAWYKGDPSEVWERVGLTTEPRDDSDNNRPVGTHTVGPWLLRILPRELKDESFAVTTHNCHPLWHTRTIIYP